MAESASSSDSGLLRELRRTARDASEMVQLRRRLLEAEVRSDLNATKRLALRASLALLALSTGLSTALVAVLLQIETATGDTDHVGMLVVGVSLIFAAVATVWLAFGAWRRDWLGLRDSIDELKRDADWLKRWASEVTD
ncbi:MAG: phage holin family protein [Pirellulaceae bacterium]|jgi:uncharacterized membrane protein YqjE|nr:phage holin family protein [Pirellulaceae bacterium]MDP7020168.1 phage holin family protein [Pirellulaceae bacterium]